MKSLIPNSRAFTLVETLVAIAILMIAVAGPLVIASKGLTAALYARDQMIASFLAQESMEVIKNIRDNNIAGGGVGGPWLDAISDYDSSAPGDIDALGNSTYCDVSLGGCPMYFSTVNGYSNTNSGGAVQTIFRRYIYLTWLMNDNSPDQEVLFNVVVTWNEGSIPNELRLSSELTDSRR